MGELTHTVIGNPTVFKSADKSEIKSLKININPIQTGDGNPSPSNVKPIQGWTKIKYFKVNNLISLEPINFTPIEANGGTLNYLGNNTFYLSGAITKNTTFTFSIPHFTLKHGHIYNKVIIIESQGEGIYGIQSIGFGFKHGNATKQTLLFTPIQEYINSFNNSTEWTPEDEEIDTFVISFRAGWSNVKVKFFMTESTIESETISFPAMGKNLLDVKTYGTSQDTSMFFGRTNNTYADSLFLKAGTYTFSSNTQADLISVTNRDGSTIGGLTQNSFYHTFTITEDQYVGIVFYKANASAADLLTYQYQLEIGSSATSYEPFDNNVYGGYIDLISGKLVINYVKSILDENVIIKDLRNETSAIRFRVAHGNYGPEVYSNSNLRFSYLSFDNTQGVPWGGYITVTSGASYGNLIIRLPAEYNTEEKIKAYLKDHPLEVGYRIYPIEYQLTPQQMQTFLGENCFIAASNGDVEVEYAFTDHLAKRKLILNEPHIETVSGTLNSFNTDLSAPLKECKINFYPAQDLYANPSPTNIKSISGWNGVQLIRNNFLPIDLNGFTTGQLGSSNGIINYLGDNTYEFIGSTEDSGSVIIPIQPITFLPNTSYHVMVIKELENGMGSGSTALNIAFKNPAGGNIFVCRPNYIGWSNNICRAYVTFTESKEAASLGIGIPQGSSSFRFKFFLSADVFTASSIDWSTNYGTLYGGYIDLANGELVQTHACFNTTWGEYSQSHNNISGGNATFTNYERRIFIPDIKFKGANLSTGCFCNVSPKITSDYNGDSPFFTMGNQTIILKLPVGTDDNLPLQFVADLATPIEYQLTPQQIKTLKGTNNIWSNANGAVDIKYWTH